MAQAVLAHRSDEQTVEAPEPPGSDHQQRRARSRLEQRPGGEIANRAGLDIGGGLFPDGLRDECVQRGPGLDAPYFGSKAIPGFA